MKDPYELRWAPSADDEDGYPQRWSAIVDTSTHRVVFEARHDVALAKLAELIQARRDADAKAKAEMDAKKKATRRTKAKGTPKPKPIEVPPLPEGRAPRARDDEEVTQNRRPSLTPLKCCFPK
jgi:hypothetical protein